MSYSFIAFTTVGASGSADLCISTPMNGHVELVGAHTVVSVVLSICTPRQSHTLLYF